MKGYRWGIVQGWALLAFGTLALLLHFSILLLNTWGIFGAVAQIVAGFGLIQRSRYGIVAFCACGILFVVGAIQGFMIEAIQGRVAYLCGALLSWWLIPALFYYRKRWGAFTWQGGKKAVAPLPDLQDNQDQ